jgi:hypothetical protein
MLAFRASSLKRNKEQIFQLRHLISATSNSKKIVLRLDDFHFCTQFVVDRQYCVPNSVFMHAQETIILKGLGFRV